MNLATQRQHYAEIRKRLWTPQRKQKIKKIPWTRPYVLDGNVVHLKSRSSRIIDAVCEYYGITREQITSPRRFKDITFPRHVAIYLLKEKIQFSWTEIGKKFGGQDHTTVLYAWNKIHNRLAEPEMAVAIQVILSIAQVQ